MSFLETMARASRARFEEDSRALDLDQLKAVAPGHMPPIQYLSNGFDLWAEVKPASPTSDWRAASEPVPRALEYQRGGASVISVLTEPTAFGGSFELLSRVADAVDLPVMAKDFYVHPYQVWQARAAGASGVLLIEALLAGDMLEQMLEATQEAGMFALLEAFDQEQLDRVSRFARNDAPAVVCGVNCRNLVTLEADPLRFASIDIAGKSVIAESGVRSPADVKWLAGLGYSGVLAGSALMTERNPGALVERLVAAGRPECLSA